MKTISIFLYKKLNENLETVIHLINLFNEYKVNIILFQDSLDESINFPCFMRQSNLKIIVLSEKKNIYKNNMIIEEKENLLFLFVDCMIYLI